MLLCGNDVGRVADLLVRTLVEGGVDTFYGVPGGAIAPVYDALIVQTASDAAHPVRVINTRHETGAMFMAAGQARAGGTLPCVLVTSGPGVTNVITGLASAWKDRVPLVVIAGEAPRAKFGHGALQEGSRYELDVLNMVRSITKFAAELTVPQNSVALVQKALSMAVSDRPGPVFLSLPIDVATSLVRRMVGGVHVTPRYEVDGAALNAATSYLQECRRGAIFVGSGAGDSRTIQLVTRLAEMLRMPVMTTPKGKGLFPEDSPLSLGVYGYGGHQSARKYLEKPVEVFLCIGSGLNETGTNNWSKQLTPTRAFVHVDLDPAQIGRNYPVDVALVGPAHQILEKLIERLQPPVDSLAMERYGVEFDDPPPENGGPLHPAQVVRLLQARAPRDTIFASDIGEHLLFAIHQLCVKESGGFVSSLGLGSMGSGIGNAIGVKVAKPDRPVVVICGDYGFQMYGMEVSTCLEANIGVVFAIFNDSRMRMVENGNLRVFGQTTPMHSSRINFAAIAEAIGIRGFSLRTKEDFARLPDEVFRSSVPIVLDIEIDEEAAFANNGRVAQFSHFGAKTAPNDDNGGSKSGE